MDALQSLLATSTTVFEVVAFCYRFLKNLWNLSSDHVPFWAVVEPVLFCAFLLLASLTLTDIRPVNIEWSLFASNFLPRRSCWLHYDAFQSNFPSFFDAKEQALVPAMLLLPTPHTRALLPTSSSTLIEPSVSASFQLLSDKPTSCPFFISSLNINVCHCGHLIHRSRVSHITAPAGPLTSFHV